MADHELTRSQKNDVLLAIQGSGLDPGDFTWRETHTSVLTIGPGRPPFLVEVLIHTPTDYGFAFDIDSRQRHYAVFRPGSEGPTEKTYAADWPTQLAYVREWLSYVRREYEAPDLWQELGRQRELVAGSPPAGEGNAPFTPEERELIANQLRELSALIQEAHRVDAAQIHELEARIEYAIGATERLGRFDWKNVLLSQLISLVLAAVVPQDAFGTAVGFLTRTIGHLYGIGGGPGELPGAPPFML